MTKVSVYQLTQLETGAPVLVAEIELKPGKVEDLLDEAYYMTQNLQGSWSKGPEITWDGQTMRNGDYRPEVTVMAPLPVHGGKTYGLRSTSVGDLIEVEGVTYKVAPCGFTKLEEAA